MKNNRTAIERAKYAGALLTLIALAGLMPMIGTSGEYSAATGDEPDVRTVRFNSYKEVVELYEELNYTPEALRSGSLAVPRVYLADISDRWSKSTTKNIDIPTKKRLFFRTIAPLVLRSNELTLKDRNRLLKGDIDSDWLNNLAERYGLETADFASEAGLVKELLLRVDIIPPSLVLAQAAEESGWGTSRFAFAGNALFGQWTWDGKGIRPEEQRSGKGDYRIAAFESPLQSVQAHARNLNTHRTYADFRAKRAALRTADKSINGYELAGTLSGYSERGADYVKSLRSLISYNKLDTIDEIYFGNDQAIVLIRVDNKKL